jgi:hypothetical protein
MWSRRDHGMSPPPAVPAEIWCAAGWPQSLLHVRLPGSPLASATTGAAVRVDGGYVDAILP